MPVSFAEQLSYSDSQQQNLENIQETEINNSKVVSELVINVSENGSITILDSSSSNVGLSGEPNSEIAPQDYICLLAASRTLNTWYFEYIESSGDVDWHKWNIPSSGKFTVNVNVPSNKDYDIVVYDSCSLFASPLCTSAYGMGSPEQCTVNANSGNIYTKVFGYTSSDYSSTSSYSIKGTFVSNNYNLVPGDFTVTPSSPSNADSIIVRYRTINNGPDHITTRFYSRFYIDNSPYQTCDFPNGAQAGITYYCEASSIKLSAGTHRLKNIVDADSQISETNENDNTKEQDLSVRDVTGVDLVPGDFTVTPSSPTDADSITVKYRATNLGPASVSGYFNFKLYIDNILYETCNANNGISSGSTLYCEHSGISLSRGTHTLKNVVDAGSNIAETNEGNNEKTQSLYVAQVDLVPGDFTVTPTNPSNADSITIRYRATNLGPDDITSSFNYKLYIDNVHSQTCSSSGRAAGTTGYCELSGISLTAGTHALKNVVDADSQISEANEGNNIKTQNLAVESSCPGDKPYKYDGACHLCPQSYLECGGLCYNKQNACYFGEPFCGQDNNAYCCSSSYPYACPAANTCFTSSTYCDGRPVYNCQGSAWVCVDRTAVGTCIGSTLKCCPSNYQYYWTSDGRCHTTLQTQVTCNIPDGSSSDCDCDSNSECPAAYPYCEDNYPSPISDGYDACLSSQPQYCGNGLCLSNENYVNCPQDCTAPKGTINVNVYHSSNNNAISGAYVYSDSVSQGTTDSTGKNSFEASFGQRNVKVECPDKTYCNTKTVNVDGTEYVGFGCGCNPSGDSDGDGYKDDDELLLGTDPNNPSENLKTAFSSFKNPKSCLDIVPIGGLLWNNNGNLLQSNDMVIRALNNTQVMTTDLEKNPSVLMQSIAGANLDAKIVDPKKTFKEAFKTGDKVDGFLTNKGAILVITDYKTGTTAIIAIGATCAGNFVGLLYGAGNGVKDDVVGIWELTKGIWYLTLFPLYIDKISSSVASFISAIGDLFVHSGEVFDGMIRSILKSGNTVTEKTSLFKSDRQSYLQFQIGFLTGYITGYLVEQIFAIDLAITKLKEGILLSKTGKTTLLPEVLTRIESEFGLEVSNSIKDLKYADKIAKWTLEEQNGLAMIVKLKQGKWLGEIIEAEAKIAGKNVENLISKSIIETDVEKLLNTNIGRNTLKLADATDDLLVKQIKLANNWGIETLEEVAKRYDGFWWWQKDGWIKVNRLLKTVPEQAVDGLSPSGTIKFLGDNGFVEAAEKIIKQLDIETVSRAVKSINDYDVLVSGVKFDVLDLTKVDPEKLTKYARAVNKLDSSIKNPMNYIGKHQLLKMYKSESIVTKVGDETIDSVAILKRGEHDFIEDIGFGWEHIKAGEHDLQIQQTLGLSDADKAVRDVIGEVIETGNVRHFSGDSYEITKKVVRGQKSHDIMVIISDRQGSVGSIQTAHPI